MEDSSGVHPKRPWANPQGASLSRGLSTVFLDLGSMCPVTIWLVRSSDTPSWPGKPT